jgi:sulfoxide reductase catalytic subunit YedY
VFLDRRRFLSAGAGLHRRHRAVGPRAGAGGGEEDATAGLYPAKRNEAFKLDREITPEAVSANYNNFYEFGSFKRVASMAQA